MSFNISEDIASTPSSRLHQPSAGKTDIALAQSRELSGISVVDLLLTGKDCHFRVNHLW